MSSPSEQPLSIVLVEGYSGHHGRQSEMGGNEMRNQEAPAQPFHCSNPFNLPVQEVFDMR